MSYEAIYLNVDGIELKLAQFNSSLVGVSLWEVSKTRGQWVPSPLGFLLTYRSNLPFCDEIDDLTLKVKVKD